MNSFDDLTLAGPTNFAPIISKTAAMAEESVKEQKGSKYFILLIITDGEVQGKNVDKCSHCIFSSQNPLDFGLKKYSENTRDCNVFRFGGNDRDDQEGMCVSSFDCDRWCGQQ